MRFQKMKLSNIDTILHRADQLVRKTGCRDPEAIADYLGITIMESGFRKQKGIYLVIEKYPYIFISSGMEDAMRRVVLMHEIGHDRLHRDRAAIFQDCDLFANVFDEENIMEFEANLFAAQVLLPDASMLDFIRRGMSSEEIARAMKTDINLVAFKADEMKRRGIDLRRQDHDSRFLR